jgi:hypothetical protein
MRYEFVCAVQDWKSLTESSDLFVTFCESLTVGRNVSAFVVIEGVFSG